MLKKRLLSLALALLLILSVLGTPALAGNMSAFGKNTVYDGRFTDISGWSKPYIIAAYESGLVKGDSATTFSPGGTVSLSHAVTLAARIHKLYETGSSAFSEYGKWYECYYDYCAEKGLISLTEFSKAGAETPATRRQVLRILGEALPASELAAINTIEEGAIPDIPATDPDAALIYRFYRAGVLTGDEKNRFTPAAYITREEFATIATRLTAIQPRISLTLRLPEISAARYDALTVAGKTYAIGMTESELHAKAGAPVETLDSLYPFKWQTFYDKSFKSVLVAGVDKGVVVALGAAGSDFSYYGMKPGEKPKVSDGDYETESGTTLVYVLRDPYEGSGMHGVRLLNRRYNPFGSGDGFKDGEAYITFLLTNAFRAYHGLYTLRWDTTAATVARDYGKEMADKNFFAHEGLDGRDPYDRMEDAGIDWCAGAENLAGGTTDCFDAYNGWVNSAGHRANLLNDWVTRLGCGAYFKSASYYHFYFVQDFYDPA